VTDVETLKRDSGVHRPPCIWERPEGCGDAPCEGCGGVCGLELANADRRNAFRARTRRLESSEVSAGLTGLEKFMCLGRVDGIRPTLALEYTSAIGLGSTLHHP